MSTSAAETSEEIVAESQAAPPKDRLKAGSDGTQPAMREAEPDTAPDAASDPAPDADSDAVPDAAAAPFGDSELEPITWTPVRAAIAELVWGAGYVRPGGETRLFDLVAPIGFEAGQRVLLLNAGLDGQVRSLVEKFGIQVDGREAIEILATVAMERLQADGIADKATVSAFDPETGDFGEDVYDHIVAPAACFGANDKARLLGAVHKSLKPSGHLLITDFLVNEGGDDSGSLETWTEVEPQVGSLLTEAAYIETLTDLGFAIEACEDVTSAYCNGVVKAWAAVKSTAGIKDLPPQAASVLFEEARRWVIRSAALQSGSVRLFRVHAVKSGGSVRLIHVPAGKTDGGEPVDSQGDAA